MPVFEKAIVSKRALRRKAMAEAVNEAEDAANNSSPDVSDNEVEIASEAAAPKDATLEINEPAQWVERMALTAVKPLPSDLAPDDDPKREEVFIQHTMLSVAKGLQMLDAAKVPWKRPADYYAEMYKTDVQMSRIRESIDKTKKQAEEKAHRRAMKDQKKFGKEVQAEVLRQRAKYKREMNDKISDWRKKRRGNDESLDDALEERDAKRPRREGPGKPKNLRAGGGAKRPGKNARRRK